ncbi:hypothetical protein FIBSPDRAFT_868833, partial [Athelia psychrophila]
HHLVFFLVFLVFLPTAYLFDRLRCGLPLPVYATPYYPSYTWHFSHRWNAIACTSIIDFRDFSADAFHVAFPRCPRPQTVMPRL